MEFSVLLLLSEFFFHGRIFFKEGSQETLATMVGMALGMFLARITIGQPLFIWFSFLSLTVFHMYGKYPIYFKFPLCLL